MPAIPKKKRPLERDEILEILYPPKDTVRGSRFTQDTPVTADVWVLYGRNPGSRQELILAPNRESSVPLLARAIRLSLAQVEGIENPPIIYNQSHVLARLTFDELVRAVLPLSMWWVKEIRPDPRERWAAISHLSQEPDLVHLLMDPAELRAKKQDTAYPEQLLHMARIIGCLALGEPIPGNVRMQRNQGKRLAYFKRAVDRLQQMFAEVPIALLWRNLTNADIPPSAPPLWRVYENRKAESAVRNSRETVKADAAQRLFDISCKNLRWAVVDSGIDARHTGFGGPDLDVSRVRVSYDFTRLREILFANAADSEIPSSSHFARLSDEEKQRIRAPLQRRLGTGKAIDWDQLEPILRISHDPEHYPAPENEHGTHVAGILAANMPATGEMKEPLVGMCPDLHLYDIRVFNSKGEGDEFVILAALQFIRHLNAHKDQTVIHGVNLSFSLKHSVASYACGSTPVCEEAARLVASGVVVVAAAGNRGYDSKADNGFGVYQDITITDPGNAEDVITVGSTHRQMPHKYGVSYFSSRGPTGDGRLKPDLVAPGEKIESTIPNNSVATLDGTSMAAPHVSGAAALLLARHRELVGQPRRVKEILCRAATDLGRERSFQGAGLLDVLRALQSI